LIQSLRGRIEQIRGTTPLRRPATGGALFAAYRGNLSPDTEGRLVPNQANAFSPRQPLNCPKSSQARGVFGVSWLALFQPEHGFYPMFPQGLSVTGINAYSSR